MTAGVFRVSLAMTTTPLSRTVRDRVEAGGEVSSIKSEVSNVDVICSSHSRRETEPLSLRLSPMRQRLEPADGAVRRHQNSVARRVADLRRASPPRCAAAASANRSTLAMVSK